VTQSSIDSFINSYVQALSDQNAAIFAGAGLSIPAGMVNWKELMCEIANDIGLDVSREDDLVAVAQYHYNERGGRHKINQALISRFSSKASSTINHSILASLPIRTFWTTNYDTLIEDSLRLAKKKPDVKITVQNLAITLPRRDAVIYKMHGDISQPDQAVILKDDYEAYSLNRQMFSTALQGDLVSKTFLFLGFSFNDPNLSHILSRIRILLGENKREHYCLLRKINRKDFNKTKDFEYACAKQELQVRDLRRYGISGILVNDYSEYTKILNQISLRYKRNRVFISGSAITYHPWKDNSAQDFIHDLADKLIRVGFGIVSGFGLGVGSFVLNGVLHKLAEEGTQLLDDRLVLRPFPQEVKNSVQRAQAWKLYRQDMISHAGISIFIFGNKHGHNNEAILADGVEEEFNLSVEAGLAVVPIGATGYKAAELHKKVMKNFKKYYPKNTKKLEPLFRALGQEESGPVVIKRVMMFLDKLKESH